MATRELAKKLDLIEIISIDGKLTPKYIDQYYNFLLVLDFESTCWNTTDISKSPPEVIEFPVILYDVKRDLIVEEFHQYVMPTENPKLSTFCQNFTGIQQDQVDNGVPLATCLMLFNKWINEHKNKYHMNFPNYNTTKSKCIFVTWSDWDLRICLSNECKRKQIMWNDDFSYRIDLRALYKFYYPRRTKGLSGALNEFGLKFEGKEHCGLDDARNTAKLAAKMIKDGILFEMNTKSI